MTYCQYSVIRWETSLFIRKYISDGLSLRPYEYDADGNYLDPPYLLRVYPDRRASTALTCDV